MSDINTNLLQFYLDRRFHDLEEQIMSELSDKVAEAVSSFDAAQVRVETAVAELRAEVADLRTKVATPQDLEALTALDAKIDALDPRTPATLPDEAPPAPEV